MTPDRRQAQRFAVTLLVELMDGTGITRNISAYGVFFETDRAFVVGETIEFTLVLEQVAPGHLVRLHCRGQVVRLERRHTKMGVAVAITAYRFDPCALCRVTA